MPRLSVILGSTRPGRAGEPVATWFVDRVKAHGAFDVELVDLAELDLPLLDEPKHPRFHDYRHAHTKRWSQQVMSADAFVLVTSEYNFGYPAPLKNALDFVSKEWAYAPVGFVSYGGVAAGTRAVQQLKQVVGAMKMYPLFEAVSIPFIGKLVHDGVFDAPPESAQAASAMLDELVRVEEALRPLREGVRAELG
jgi:NAD(P)H-dependent FMN reductase